MCLSKAYKVVGSKGRIYLPNEIQEAANLYPGQIVRLEAEAGRVIFTAVSMIEIGDHSPEAVESYLMAAGRQLEKERQLKLACALLEQAEKQ